MSNPVVKPFRFKQFSVAQDKCPMKVGTDGVLLAAWADVTGAGSILDIGTGSGVMALILAQRAEKAEVHGVEIDPDAASQAAENMAASPWPERLRTFATSIQDFAKENRQQYDLIVSNPPFFSGGTFSDNNDRMAVRHTIKLPHGDLLSAVRKLLAPTGRFAVILPHIEGLRFRELANSYHLFCTRLTEVHTRPGKPVERLLLQFECNVNPLQKDSLCIHDGAGPDYSEDYIALTREFYLE
ncbi:MAG: methyltransferase domain-containing protein [Bacteroidetes bacterium]|nr:MAG: methyltransferase domain-containing protein [Bacteroidota bacterium]